MDAPSEGRPNCARGLGGSRALFAGRCGVAPAGRECQDKTADQPDCAEELPGRKEKIQHVDLPEVLRKCAR